MARSITGFLAELVGQGARPNLFQISMVFPPVLSLGVGAIPGSAGVLMPFMAQATSIPPDKLGEIPVGYMGRKVYFPGDREFDPWTITIYNDETFNIHAAFELWMSALNAHQANVRDITAALFPQYTTNALIQQYPKVDLPSIMTYQMTSFFPTEVGAIELDWETNNTIEKFQVTLRYQWWDAISSTNGPTTDGGGTISLNP